VRLARGKAAGVVARMANRLLAACFDTWRERAAGALASRRRAEGIVNRLRSRALATAFQSWMEASAALGFARRQANGILARLRCRLLTVAFNLWVDATAAKAAARAAALAAVQRMANRLLAEGFFGWLAAVKWRVRNRAMVQKSLARLLALALSRALDGWRHQTACLRRARAQAAAALSRALNQAIGKAFNGWVAAVQRAVRNRGVARRCLARMQLRVLASALKGWAEASCWQKASRAKVGRSLARLRQALIWRAFSAWASEASEALRELSQLSRALAHWARGSQAAALARWGEAASEAHGQRVKVARSLARLMHRTVSRAFHSWADHASRARAIAAAILAAWREAGSVQARRREQLIRFFTRKAIGLLRHGFVEWRRAAERRRLLATLAEGIASRLLRSRTARLLLAWRDTARYFKQLRESLESQEAATRLRLLQVAWQTWRMHASAMRSVCSAVDRRFTILAFQLLRSAFLCWREAAAAAALERERRLASARRPLLSRSFYGWLYLVSSPAMPRPRPAPQQQPLPAPKQPDPVFSPRKPSATSQTPAPPEPDSYKVTTVTTRHVTSPPRYRTRGPPAYEAADYYHEEELGSGDPPAGYAHSSSSFYPSPAAGAGGKPSPPESPEMRPAAYGGSARSSVHSAYEKVLRECAVLEQKVLELEHQRQLEQVGLDLRRSNMGGVDSPQRSDHPIGILEGLREENTRLQHQLTHAAYANNPLYEFPPGPHGHLHHT